MTKSFLKVFAICTACSMLSASGHAQAQQGQQASDINPNNAGKSWSTKRLSATGRMNDNCVRVSSLVGATVNDSTGARAGQIQDIIVSPSAGHIDFALLSLNSEPKNGVSNPNPPGNLVPVPWSLLKTSDSSQYSAESGQPLFTLNNVDLNKLKSAPTVDWSNMGESEWRQRIYSYYGVTPKPSSSMGAAESPGGQIKVEPAHPLNSPPDPRNATPPPTPPEMPPQNP